MNLHHQKKRVFNQKSITYGKSMGVFNNNLFLIIDEKILFIPLQEIISSTDIQITNLVNDKTNSFAAKYNLIKNKNIIKNRLNLAAIKLKRLHLLNKLQKKFLEKMDRI